MERDATSKSRHIAGGSWYRQGLVIFALLCGCSSNYTEETQGRFGANETSSRGDISLAEEVDDDRNWGSLEKSAANAQPAPPVNAQSCSAGNECASGFCVDGVCCDGACTGTCEACTASKKGNGADGVCGLIALYGDPDNECAAGSCDGAGACKLYNGNTCSLSTTCLSGYCVDGFCCGNACTGTCRACSIAKRGGGYNGQCGPIAAASDPDNECNGSSCNGQSACELLGGGNACSQNAQCATGFCVDGVCCDSACSGSCQACSAAKKGGGADGTCGSIPTNVDPDNECADGVCNGSGGCIKYNGATCSSTSECISTYCVDGFCCGNACAGTCYSCSAAKHGGYNGQCLPTTASTDPDNECGAGDCNGSGACTVTMLLAIGSACTMNAECASSQCVDGYCCDNACSGSCEACSSVKKGGGSDGICGAIAANTDPENDCLDGVCNGSGGCIKYNGATCAAAGECISTYCVDGYCCGNACEGTCYSCSAAKNGSGYNGQCLPIAASTDPDGECGAGTCNGSGMCTTPALLPNGSACSSGSECDSSFCTDGYCCDVACSGTCRACSAAKKGSGADGACGFIAAGTNPDDECAGAMCDGGGNCTSNGQCTGTLWLSEPPMIPVYGAIAAADLNGDGITDLAVTSTADDAVGVMFGNGNGTYGAKVNYPVGPNPTSIITADMNGDGKLDLVVVDSISKGVSVVLNNGNGTFGLKLDFSFGAVVPRAVTAADMNGDGKVDLALPMANNTMSVLLNTGAGTFYAHLSYATGTDPKSIASADLNADGNVDLVVPNMGSNNVSVFLNNGNGTFAPKVDSAVSSPQSVVVADMNGDGKFDIVATGGVLLNNGNGTFAAYVSTPTLSLSGTVAAGDMNGDGKTDIAVVEYGTSDVRVFLNNGNGTAFSRTIYTTPRPSTIVLADLNGNGTLDIAVGTNAGLAVILGNGNGVFAANLDYATGAVPYSVAAADFNGDGQQDLAIANGGGASVSVLLNNGDDTFATKVDYSAGLAPRSVVAADVNGDGHSDLAVANYSDNNLSVHINQGNGTFASKKTYLTGPYGYALGPNSVAAADFNGDGAIDLVAANNQVGNAAVLLNNGNGTFAAVVNYGLGVNPAAVATADFNGDGKPDLAIANEGSHTVSVLLNNGNGTFAPKVDYATGTIFSGFPIYIATADMDGNNKPDLVVANRDGSITVHLNNGNGTFAPKVAYETTTGWYSVALADMDGDGNRDIVATNRYSNTVSVLRNISGNGTFAPRVDYATGSYPRAVAAADLGGDDKPDLAVVSEQGATVRVLVNACIP